MVSTLTSIAMQYVTLEDILEIGLESLPASDDFLRSLARTISEEIVPYYERIGWKEFTKDLLFLVQNEGELLDYDNVSIYWSAWNQQYLLISAEANDRAASYFIYESLDEVMAQLFLTLIENHESLRDADIESPITLVPKQKEVYDFMALRYQDDVDTLWNYLDEGGLVEITGQLGIFALYPLNDTSSAYVVMDDEKLVIIGLFSNDLFDDIDPEFGQRSTPFAIHFPRDDARRILAILVYNPEAYQLI